MSLLVLGSNSLPPQSENRYNEIADCRRQRSGRWPEERAAAASERTKRKRSSGPACGSLLTAQHDLVDVPSERHPPQ